MTDPITAKVIKISIANGVAGQQVTLRNRTTGEEMRITLGENTKGVASMGNFTSGYTESDVIDISISGERVGHTSVTLSGDASQTATITSSAITSGLARGL